MSQQVYDEYSFSRHQMNIVLLSVFQKNLLEL
jgi:hypothetical protein